MSNKVIVTLLSSVMVLTTGHQALAITKLLTVPFIWEYILSKIHDEQCIYLKNNQIILIGSQKATLPFISYMF